MKHFAPHGPVPQLPAKSNRLITEKEPEPSVEEALADRFVDQGGNSTLGLLAGLALDAFLDRHEK
jgi:hypothetical protein